MVTVTVGNTFYEICRSKWPTHSLPTDFFEKTFHKKFGCPGCLLDLRHWRCQKEVTFLDHTVLCDALCAKSGLDLVVRNVAPQFVRDTGFR